MEKDLFGFEKAIQLDHLTNEQIDELLKMFDTDQQGRGKMSELHQLR